MAPFGCYVMILGAILYFGFYIYLFIMFNIIWFSFCWFGFGLLFAFALYTTQSHIINCVNKGMNMLISKFLWQDDFEFYFKLLQY